MIPIPILLPVCAYVRYNGRCVMQYRQLCDKILITLAEACSKIRSPAAGKAVAAYLAFLNLKESVGVERATVCGMLASGRCDGWGCVDLAVNLGMQAAYERSFLQIVRRAPRPWRLRRRGRHPQFRSHTNRLLRRTLGDVGGPLTDGLWCRVAWGGVATEDRFATPRRPRNSYARAGCRPSARRCAPRWTAVTSSWYEPTHFIPDAPDLAPLGLGLTPAGPRP